MKVQELFVRDIHRPINGVVKADQLDASIIWQELDEFVVTRELGRHIQQLVDVLLSTINSPMTAADKNGVWVSGFFGCGKSHFIKVLSYLLENRTHRYRDQHQQAVDFFEKKLDDAMLYGDLKRVVATTSDTILFNIDSKADHRDGRDALLQVFLKVLNEKQGYSGDYPHIANMERYLDERGLLDDFHAAFQRKTGDSWLKERDAWEFRRDEVMAALKGVLKQSDASVEALVEGAESNFSLTVENFARWVKRYLDSKGPGHRIMFLVDEVGQFIGNDTHLMLNLQTITEKLGTTCQGRAWVVVTSQEDLDAVLGDLKNVKQHDFSKIQGRFKTRLSLSSANVDEVIKKRLLDKANAALAPLHGAYDGKQDILRNQLSFVNAGMTFPNFTSNDDFSSCYPFASYQFNLVQKVFETIRKAGATGLHLAQGERSLLEAFQSAAKQVGTQDVGVLVPFYCFYPAVKSFLDTTVKRTIERASENHALKPFDATLLQVLFLIRYIDELPGNVDNLVTLCIDEIDADKLALRKKIEASLARLERETLIARNGELYFFLTNEERDIGREIKNQTVPSGEEERELGKLLFEDLLGDIKKHTYSLTKRDFALTRICDDHPVGNRLDGSVEVVFVSPLGDQYKALSDDGRCILHTGVEQGQVLIRLPDDNTLGRELRIYLQTNAYVKAKHTGSLPDTTKRILRDRTEENRERRRRMVLVLKEMARNASYFANGKKLDISQSDPKKALGEALESLIQNAYPKMGYIQHLQVNPKPEIQSTLRANDIEQIGLGLSTTSANAQALNDLREYVRLCGMTSKQIVLHDLINKRYGQRPYGWPELEIVLLVAKLAVLKEVALVANAAPLPLEQAYDHLVTSSKQRKVVIRQRQVADKTLLNKARSLGQKLFGRQGPTEEDALFTDLKKECGGWIHNLKQYRPLAETGDYPGLREIRGGLQVLEAFTREADSLRFLKRFVKNQNELLDLSEDYEDLKDFYTNQKGSWETLRVAVQGLSQNSLQLNVHPTAGPALRQMQEILKAPHPYGMLHKVAGLTATAEAVNDDLIAKARKPVVEGIQGLLEGIKAELDKVSAAVGLRNTATSTLERLLQSAQASKSIAHIHQARQAAEPAFDKAMTAIEQSQKPPPTSPGNPPPKSPTPPVKKRRTVAVRKLCPGNFLETQADVDTFLSALRAELEGALAANERIQIK
jgi:hypothetical protein